MILYTIIFPFCHMNNDLTCDRRFIKYDVRTFYIHVLYLPNYIFIICIRLFRSIHMHVIQSRQEPLYLCNFTMYIHLNLYSIAQMQACSSCNFMFEIHYQKFFLQCWSRYLYQVYLFLRTRYMRMHICIIDILKPFIHQLTMLPCIIINYIVVGMHLANLIQKSLGYTNGV